MTTSSDRIADLNHTKETDTGNTTDDRVSGPEDDVEKNTAAAEPSDLERYGPPPDGGVVAWLVAVGGFCVLFAALGFSNSFGVFEEYYMTHQLASKSADTIAWIGSCNVFFQFMAGVVAGPLFDRFGALIVQPSALLCVFAVMMTSLCKEYYQFFLAQGVLLGLCSGGMQFPAMAATMQYFDKNRGAALGIMIAGSSIGGVIFPIALSRMLNNTEDARRLGFGWAVRIVGFVMLATLILPCFSIKPRLPSRPTSFFIGAAWRQADYVLLIASFFLCFLGFMMPLFYLPSYAVTIGTQTTLASYLLAIVNGASTFGRIIPGILADRLGRINVLAVGCAATGVVTLCLTKVTSTAGLVVFAVFFGLTSGTIVSGMSAAMSVCVSDARNMGTYMGMGMGVGSIAVLIGPPINGHLIHQYGYLQASIFSGVMCLAGAAVAFVAKIATPKGLWGRV